MEKTLLNYTCPALGIRFAKLIEFILWGLFAVALICVPSYLVSQSPMSWNALSQILFQVITAFFSVLIGYRLSKVSLENQITRKWLRPAQTACNQIQVMMDQTQRLRKTRKTTCDELQDLLEGLEDIQRHPIEKIVRTKCESCKARLMDLQNHLSNAYETWRVFIHENCEKIMECSAIENELAEFRETLNLVDDDKP